MLFCLLTQHHLLRDGTGRRWVWGLWWEMRPAEGYIWDGFLLPLAIPQPTHPPTYIPGIKTVAQALLKYDTSAPAAQGGRIYR